MQPIDWTQIILALIAGIPAMIAALATFLVTLKGTQQIRQTVIAANAKCATEVKNTVVAESAKTATVAQEVKNTLITSNHQKELKAQETAHKLDYIVQTTEQTKTLVNGNMTSLLQTSAEALTKVVDIAAALPAMKLPQESPTVQKVEITGNSEIKMV